MRRRLDAEMVRRGMARNRSEAAVAIRAGSVSVGGRPALKGGYLVDPEESISMRGAARRFASRGGEKLDAALTRFSIAVSGRLALDAGASTGGFTDCLLQRGAARVVAVDVGYGQLAWHLRNDARVTVLERTNVRHLTPERLPYRPDLLAVDVSFISLRLVLPSLVLCSSDQADFVLLVKPQFEAGREEANRSGVVSDPSVWLWVLQDIGTAASRQGLAFRGVMASPLVGPAGNVEFLVHAVLDGSEGSGADWSPALEAAVEDGIQLSAKSSAG